MQSPGSPCALIGRVRGTESTPLNVVNALRFACPLPERGTNWMGALVLRTGRIEYAGKGP